MFKKETMRLTKDKSFIQFCASLLLENGATMIDYETYELSTVSGNFQFCFEPDNFQGWKEYKVFIWENGDVKTIKSFSLDESKELFINHFKNIL
jgi:hypothetical protein